MFAKALTRRAILSFAATTVVAATTPALATLTIDLRTPAGSKSATVSHVGDTLPLELYAQVTGSNATDSDEQMWSLFGSILSANVNDGVVRGDLSVSIVHPFQSVSPTTPPITLYSNGSAADLDGDGDLDVGSNNDSSSDGFIYPRGETAGIPGPFPPPYLGTPIPNGREWKIADVSFHVTDILSTPQPGAQTAVNFRWREAVGLLSIIAIWEEDGVWYTRNHETYVYNTSTIAPGVDVSTTSPLLFTVAVPEPATLPLLAFTSTLLRRRRH